MGQQPLTSTRSAATQNGPSRARGAIVLSAGLKSFYLRTRRQEVERLDSSSKSARQHGDDKKDDGSEKDDLGDTGGGPGEASETENGGDKSYYEKGECPAKHFDFS